MGGDDVQIPAPPAPGIPARGFRDFRGEIVVHAAGDHEFVVFVEHEYKFSVPFGVANAK